MGNRVRDAAFAQFVADQRRTLLGAGYLMFSSAERAEQVVQATLARLYSSWPPRAPALQAVLRELLTSTPAHLVLPWQRADRVELLDRPLDATAPSGIVADLAELAEEDRRVVILAGFVGLTMAETAAVLGREPSEVPALLAAATARLAERDPVRKSADRLREQLCDAAREASADPDMSGASDLAHGRLLVRRRMIRTFVVAGVAILASLMGFTQLTSTTATRADEPAAGHATSAPPVLASPASARPTCDTRQASCREDELREWRSRMALVTRSYVDPGHDYFGGYTFGRSGLYESPKFWAGGDGVLGLDMSRLVTGATEVYLQVATSRRAAVRCGELTQNECLPHRFLDGNTYTLTQTTDLSQGIEVQYSPLGDEVARNVNRGKTLDVTRADLMALVADPRLRLPPR
jgi:DNA-directed RNA polymerase specialized sigma24 family protein